MGYGGYWFGSGSGMYILGTAATVFALIGLEALGLIFKSVGMRSLLIVFSTSDKMMLRRITEKIDNKSFRIMSYQMDENNSPCTYAYRVSIVFKVRNNVDENKLLMFMQTFPEIQIERIE